jgi:hypothetical protein
MAQPTPPREPGLEDNVATDADTERTLFERTTIVAPEYVERPWLAAANGGETIVTRLARVEAAIPRLEEDIRGLVDRIDRLVAFIGHKP